MIRNNSCTIHICSCRAYVEGETLPLVKAFAQWDEIFALQSERAKEADNPSHARLILMLAFFFEFSLGFYGPTPFGLYIRGKVMTNSWKFLCVRISTMHIVQLNIAMSEMFTRLWCQSWELTCFESRRYIQWISSAGSELPDHIQD